MICRPIVFCKHYKNASKLICCRRISTAEDIVFESRENVGIITINRPKALNVLSLNMVNEMHSKLKEWENKKSFIIVKAAGEKAFCAGGDIIETFKSILKGEKGGFQKFRNGYSLNYYIGNYKTPYVALIDGIVMGAGVGISVHGPYRVATERSVLAMPETAIGLVTDCGSSYFLPKLTGKLGIYIALTGHRLVGSDVYKTGIATHYCESKYLKELELALLKSNTNQDIKQVLNKFNNKDEKPFSLNPVLSKINKCFAGSTVEQILKELESDGSNWAKDVLNVLDKKSPTSLKLTLKALNEGSKLPLNRCFEMEYRIAFHCLHSNDFLEGVRALLIDKDQKPKWNPSSVENVTDAMIHSYFEKLSDEEELKLNA